MAIMSKLRDKTHIVLFILVAAFIGLGVFQWGMNFKGPASKGTIAGKVNGNPIPMARYEEIYNGLREQFSMSNGGAEITSQVEAGLREQAWDYAVTQSLVDELAGKFGIRLGDSEVLAAIRNTENPPVTVRQYFSDPATGKIDRKKLESVLADPKNKPLLIQKTREELMNVRLFLALNSMALVTRPEIDEVVNRQFTRFTGEFINFPLSYAGPATSFPVKPEEVKAWYDGHKEQFRQQPTRSAEYVVFPMTPSTQDSLAAKKEIDGLLPQFASAADDSSFVRRESDTPGAVNVRLSRADFSPEGGSAVFGSPRLASGQIIGPIADGGFYRLIKVRSVGAGQPAASASHILIRYNQADRSDTERAVARVEAVYGELRKGVPFETLAARYSEDPGSARNGGRLGWFVQGRMVPEFTQAVFAAKPGQIIGPVRTRYGLHIIRVEGFDQRQITGSVVSRQIKPSSGTTEAIRSKAVAFQGEAKSRGFEAAARTARLDIMKTGEFAANAAVPAIGYSDKVSQFVNRASTGDLSEVIETDQGFLLMKLTVKNDSGYHELDATLKQAIESELVREKMGTALKAKISALAKRSGGSLDAVAAADPSLRKVASNDIRWRDGLIAGYGMDPVLVEAMAGMKLNRLSPPVKSSNGYALAMLTGRTVAQGAEVDAEKAKIPLYLRNIRQRQVISEYLAAMKKAAKIEDLRN